MGWWSDFFNKDIETYEGKVVKQEIAMPPPYKGEPSTPVEEMLHPILKTLEDIDYLNAFSDTLPDVITWGCYEEHSYTSRRREVYSFYIQGKPVDGVSSEFVRYWKDEIKRKYWKKLQEVESFQREHALKQFVKLNTVCKES